MSDVKIAIDRGGTFTDFLAIIPGQEDHVFKLLSVDPANYEDANIEGIRRILEHVQGKTIPRGKPLDTSIVSSIRLGTTVATNALLERKGAKCAFVTTKGFKDLLRIGDQSRPDLFALKIVKPGVLYEEVVEIDERVTMPAYTEDPQLNDCRELLDGKRFVEGTTKEVFEILKPIDLDAAKRELQRLRSKGFKSVAICLIHGYNFQEHEKKLKNLAIELGFEFITTSHEIIPMIKAVPRAQSAVLDAYLTPVVKEYIHGLLKGFKPGFEKHTRIEFMQSDGGMCTAEHFTGLKALLSGPAGGVVGEAETCYDAEYGVPIIGFDMGGTSTDVSRYAGQYEHVFETSTAGINITVPQLDINTVAAGGGSILFYKNGIFVVGPESAGSHPGPACYRKGGPLTVTDANLVTGRIVPEQFPRIFGPDANEPLDVEISKKKFEELTALINRDNPGSPKTVEEVALGFLTVANYNMAKLIRTLTESKGYDITRHNLASFGGAGGQHAAPMAEILKIKRVVIHKYSSILSAYGIALADTVVEKQIPCSAVYKEDAVAELMEKCEILKEEAKQKLLSQGLRESDTRFDVFFNMGYHGSETKLMISQVAEKDFFTSFRESHLRQFTFVDDERDVIVHDLRVRGTGALSKVVERSPYKDLETVAQQPVKSGVEVSQQEIAFDEGKMMSKVYFMKDLSMGDIIAGPAMILDETQTILVTPGARAINLPRHIIIDVDNEKTQEEISLDHVDPILLSVFSNRFMFIAEDMGRTLQKISVSANIKERMDFSCALFDEDGNLTANAPHVPVHLGSMSFSIKYAIEYWKDNIHEGDVLATNHPVAGGTHLPDITIISPVFIEGKIRFFTASRAHHAEIGGLTPGSGSTMATSLAEEGAQFEAWKIVSKGQFDYKGLHKYFMEVPAEAPGCSPTRKLEDNVSDLKAQIAANQRGVNLLVDLFKEYGVETVLFYMRNVKKTAEMAVRAALRKLAQTHRGKLPLRAEEVLDTGSKIVVTIDINEEDGSAVYDFTGTTEQVYSPQNSPIAVTHACVIYGLRCIINSDIPLNEGCLVPIEIIVPEGTLLNPSKEAAVSSGNGSGSQILTETIFKAYQVVGSGPGSMNALHFGVGGLKNGQLVKGFGMVETIGAGSGATEGADGFSGTQCHMTNTKITDPEVLEKRYPCILWDWSIRKGTGGEGKWKGGDGLQRIIQFTTKVEASISSFRRATSPYGMAGGCCGARGINKIGKEMKDGSVQWFGIGAFADIVLQKGMYIAILTPGGGGYGDPKEREKVVMRTGHDLPRAPLAGGTLSNIVEAANTSQ
ncbi:hypothetical protein KL942_003429 [Ogataea angusta]|uniref:5-oxoprolinase n=1 Tax=Pichia angusta TaxID=870730 RepID=A0ABQ7RWI4_PICAN|nr:hypothetical protein KL942_003429 [Ogataea angusta]KAG7849451.1 hypothetical protein KL940_003133 [Ogataea angusta]